MIQNIELLKCPACSSTNLNHKMVNGKKKCICKDCHALFSPFKPYRGRFKKHSESLKLEVATLYSQGYSVKQIQQKIFPEHDIKQAVLNRWLRQRGIAARSRKHLQNMKCPLCHAKGEVVHDGYVLNSLGIKQEQRFLCRVCGNRFTLARVIGVRKYSKVLVQEAINYYCSPLSPTLDAVSKHLHANFGLLPDITTIHDWLINAEIKTRGHASEEIRRKLSRHATVFWKNYRAKKNKLGVCQ